MAGGKKHLIALFVTVLVFIIYAICYALMDLNYGLRSVWPVFFFIYAFSLYLASRPLREEGNAK